MWFFSLSIRLLCRFCQGHIDVLCNIFFLCVFGSGGRKGDMQLGYRYICKVKKVLTDDKICMPLSRRVEFYFF